MAYLLGSDVTVAITTENLTEGVDLSASPVAPKANPAEGIAGGKIIGKLGGLTALDDTANVVANLEGVQYNPSKESETKVFHGSTLDHIIPLRQKFDVTLTITGEGREFAKLFHSAPFGVTGTGETAKLVDGLEEYDEDVGYRIYLIMKDKVAVLYHALMPDDGFKEEIDPNKVVVQTIKFVGNMWDPDVAVTDLGTAKPLA